MAKTKETVVIPITMHKIQADIMRGVIGKTVDLSKDTLREIGNKIGTHEAPQQIKHHLETLVKMGALDIRQGNYFFDFDFYNNRLNPTLSRTITLNQQK